MIEILLGIFRTGAYKEMNLSNNWHNYPFIELIGHTNQFGSVIDVVEAAIQKADRVHFILDGIHLPLTTVHSVSCQELSLIINNKKYLNKTKFYFQKQEVDKEEMMNLIISSMTSVPLTFSSLNSSKCPNITSLTGVENSTDQKIQKINVERRDKLPTPIL